MVLRPWIRFCALVLTCSLQTNVTYLPHEVLLLRLVSSCMMISDMEIKLNVFSSVVVWWVGTYPSSNRELVSAIQWSLQMYCTEGASPSSKEMPTIQVLPGDKRRSSYWGSSRYWLNVNAYTRAFPSRGPWYAFNSILDLLLLLLCHKTVSFNWQSVN